MEAKRNNSRKRQAMLDALRAVTDHPSAEMLYTRLKPDFPELSFGTVYRNLSILVENGDIITVGKVDGQERYDATVAPHAHFICNCCHRVIDLELPDTVSNMYSEIESTTGCRPESFNLAIKGLCDACLSEDRAH